MPDNVDRLLRRRAKQLGKSFNQVALDARVAGAGLPLRPKRDLTGVVGSMSAEEAAEMEEELRLQRQVDEELWR